MSGRSLVGAGAGAAAVRAAVQRQTRSVPSGWTWVLDGAAIPHLDALERFEQALRDWPGPSLVLLAGKVVLRDGGLDPHSAPWPRLTNKNVAVDACERHMVSIRAARHGSLLVRTEALGEAGLANDIAWTASILRHGTGLLVPASLAVRNAPAKPPGLRARARALRGHAFAGEEKLWVGFLLGQDAVRALSRPGLEGPPGQPIPQAPRHHD